MSGINDAINDAPDYKEEKKEKKTPAAQCMEQTERRGVEFFHTPDRDAYASVPTDKGGRLNYRVREREFRLYIKGVYHEATGKPLTDHYCDVVLDGLEACAIFKSPCQEVSLRYAEMDGALFVDCGDATGATVKITPGFYEVTYDAPVSFRRGTGMRALPRPVAGGNLEGLRKLLHLEGASWHMAQVYMLGGLNPNGPFFGALISGAHGTGKSVAADVMKRVMDPSAIARARLPKDERDLFLIAQQSAALNFDNTSHVRAAGSDALCAILTGGTYTTRKLYTDDTLHLVQLCRPVAINGIGNIANRPDLLDRMVPIKIPPFDGPRREEKEIFSELDDMLPGILGCLYKAAAHGLKFRDKVEVPAGIRMADAARWIAACEGGLDLPEGTLVDAIISAQAEMQAEIVAEDRLYLALVDIVATKEFSGLVGQLYDRIIDAAGHNTKWLPATPSHLSNQMTRLAAPMAILGLHFEFGDHGRDGRPVRVWREAKKGGSDENM